MAVKHVYNQTVADGTATSVVRPSDWNSAHVFTQTISGNTAGQSTVSGTNLVFQGGNNITLSASTAANAATIHVSAPNGGGAGASTGGNVAGTTGLVTGQVVFAGGNNITVSQSTNGDSATVSIVGAAGAGGYTVNGFIPFQDAIAGTLAQGNGTIYVHPHILPGAVTFDRIGIYVNYSQATNSTLTVSITQRMGIYTKNGSTLSLLSSYQGTMSVNGSGTASSASYSGPRIATFGMSGSHSGNVWIAMMLSTATAGANASISQFFVSQMNSSVSGVLGAGTANTVGLYPGRGYFSNTSSVMPVSMAFNQITQNSSAAQRTPIFFLTNGTN